MSRSLESYIQFDPIREICRNRCFDVDEQFVCVFTHGEHGCVNTIRDPCKIEAMQLAAKMQNQSVKEISWADLWKFTTNVHCVHPFDEAVNFELPYILEILAGMVQEQRLQEEKQRRLEEWQAELRRGEEKEDARRFQKLLDDKRRKSMPFRAANTKIFRIV